MKVADVNGYTGWDSKDVQDNLRKFHGAQSSTFEQIHNWQYILLMVFLNLAPIIGYTNFLTMSIPTEPSGKDSISIRARKLWNYEMGGGVI